MPFELADIRDWHQDLSCTPTALAAISGKTPNEIGVLLQHAGRANGREIPAELRGDYSINDWLVAVNLLGGDWVEADKFDDVEYGARPTIDQWMSSHSGADLELVFSDDGNGTAHVFATIAGDVIDTFTNGRRVTFIAVPETYRGLRVKRSFLIFDR